MAVLTLSRLQISHGNILIRCTWRHLVISITLLFAKYDLSLKLRLIVVNGLNRENLALTFTLVALLCGLLLRNLRFLRLPLVQLDVCGGYHLPLVDCVGLVVISTILKDVPSLFIGVLPRLLHLFEFVLVYGFDLVGYIRRFAYKSLLLLSKIKLWKTRIVRYQSCANTGETLSLSLLYILPRLLVVSNASYFGRLLVRVDNWVTHNFVLVQILNDFRLSRLYCLLKCTDRLLILFCLFGERNRLGIQSLTWGPLSFFDVNGYEFVQLIEPRPTILALWLTALPIFRISFPFLN